MNNQPNQSPTPHSPRLARAYRRLALVSRLVALALAPQLAQATQPGSALAQATQPGSALASRLRGESKSLLVGCSGLRRVVAAGFGLASDWRCVGAAEGSRLVEVLTSAPRHWRRCSRRCSRR